MVCNVQGMDNIIVLKLSKLSYIKSDMREANFDMVQNQVKDAGKPNIACPMNILVI